MKEQTSNRTTFFGKAFFISLTIMLIIGMVIGYGIWGKKGDDKPNVRHLLSEISKHIKTIENQNTQLKGQLKKMKGTVKKGEKAIQSMEVMKGDLAKLKDDSKKLKAQLKKLDDLKIENERLKKALKGKTALAEEALSLKRENEELRKTLERVEDVIKKPNTPFQPDHPSS